MIGPLYGYGACILDDDTGKKRYDDAHRTAEEASEVRVSINATTALPRLLLQ